MAELVALDQRRIEKLRQQMTRMREREEFPGTRIGGTNHVRRSHRALEAEETEIRDNIIEMVIPFVLCRYGLREQADLYENDRRHWDYLR